MMTEHFQMLTIFKENLFSLDNNNKKITYASCVIVRLCVCSFRLCVSITQTETPCLSAFILYQLNSSPIWHFCSFLRQLCRLASGFVSTISLTSSSSLSSHLFLRHRDPTFTFSPHPRSRPFMLERSVCGSMASVRLTDYCNSYTLISCTNH